MGLFSWETADTKKSIAVEGSSRPTFTVYMITEDGRIWKEENYQGYGEFGGRDIYCLIAELNGITEKEIPDLQERRVWAITLVHDNGNDMGEFEIAVKNGVKVPKLVEHLDRFENIKDYPRSCKYQGFFYYDDEEENDDYYDEYEY